ncbi:MAG TPA: hypothetical protein VJB02_02770 [Coxiellaceae bacterium]|nr:hypothetical protein [Coxiellaceae bacterium]
MKKHCFLLTAAVTLLTAPLLGYGASDTCDVTAFKFGIKTNDQNLVLQPWVATDSEIQVSIVRPAPHTISWSGYIIIQGEGVQNCLYQNYSAGTKGTAEFSGLQISGNTVTIPLLIQPERISSISLLVVPKPNIRGTSGYKDISFFEKPSPGS